MTPNRCGNFQTASLEPDNRLAGKASRHRGHRSKWRYIRVQPYGLQIVPQRMRLVGLGHDQKTRGFLVDAVYDTGAFLAANADRLLPQ